MPVTSLPYADGALRTADFYGCRHVALGYCLFNNNTGPHEIFHCIILAGHLSTIFMDIATGEDAVWDSWA